MNLKFKKGDKVKLRPDITPGCMIDGIEMSERILGISDLAVRVAGYYDKHYYCCRGINRLGETSEYYYPEDALLPKYAFDKAKVSKIVDYISKYLDAYDGSKFSITDKDVLDIIEAVDKNEAYHDYKFIYAMLSISDHLPPMDSCVGEVILQIIKDNIR